MGKLVNSEVHDNYISKTFTELERASCCIEGSTLYLKPCARSFKYWLFKIRLLYQILKGRYWTTEENVNVYFLLIWSVIGIHHYKGHVDVFIAVLQICQALLPIPTYTDSQASNTLQESQSLQTFTASK